MTRKLVPCLPVLIAVSACQPAKPPADTTQAQPPAAAAPADLPSDVALAVTVARAVEANPAATDSILAAHGLTRAGLDSLIFAIAADSAKAAVYSDALR
jgi:hypothetical protein